MEVSGKVNRAKRIGYPLCPDQWLVLLYCLPLQMVYKYVRTSNQATWSENSLKNAIHDVKEKGESINSAAKKYGIPFATLYRHVKSGNTNKTLGRFKPIFTREQEEQLCNYLKELDGLFFGVTRVDFLKLAYDYASQNNIEHPFKNGMAGEDWFARFKQRHPEIVLRAPEPTSIARARGFNRPQVERFYTILWDQIQKHNFDASSIYNMDETGVRTSSSKPPKILSIRGKKQVGVISSAERGQLTTVICCCNAAGSYVPPFFIFARKRMQERLLDGAPPGAQATVTDNGWINGPTFLLWLQFFVEKVRPSDERKIMLLLDNHEAHKYFPALEYATANNVVFVSFAPHTTNKMQPLDVAIYGPIKKYFEQELSRFQKSHPGRIINQYDIAKLFAGAYVKGASVQNAIQGFEKPGIWPYDPHVFGDEDFAPATMTDRPMIETAPASESSALNFQADNIQPDISVEEPPSRSSPFAEPIDLLTPPRPATVSDETFYSPFVIRPIPKMDAPKTTRKRKSQKAEVLTSTPVKNEQAMKFHKITGTKTKMDKLVGQSKASLSKAGSSKGGPSKVKKTKKNYQNKENKKYPCLVCGEDYIEPVLEDWIQCNQCLKWAHESCTSYSGCGSYFCDECED